MADCAKPGWFRGVAGGDSSPFQGSDVGGRSFSSQLAKVSGANIPEAAKQLILCDNLKRLMTPILKAKGIEP